MTKAFVKILYLKRPVNLSEARVMNDASIKSMPYVMVAYKKHPLHCSSGWYQKSHPAQKHCQTRSEPGADPWLTSFQRTYAGMKNRCSMKRRMTSCDHPHHYCHSFKFTFLCSQEFYWVSQTQHPTICTYHPTILVETSVVKLNKPKSVFTIAAHVIQRFLSQLQSMRITQHVFPSIFIYMPYILQQRSISLLQAIPYVT